MKTSLNFNFIEFNYNNLVSGSTKEFILAEYQWWVKGNLLAEVP